MVTTLSLIQLGSRVRLHDQDGAAEFTIVGPEESDVVAGLIPDVSPLGEALLGHRPGERIEVRTPGGPRSVTIVDVL
jgi:transcription elongation factor GreA